MNLKRRAQKYFMEEKQSRRRGLLLRREQDHRDGDGQANRGGGRGSGQNAHRPESRGKEDDEGGSSE